MRSFLQLLQNFEVHVQANYTEADINDWVTRSGKRSEEDPPAGNIIQLYSRRAGDGVWKI